MRRPPSDHTSVGSSSEIQLTTYPKRMLESDRTYQQGPSIRWICRPINLTYPRETEDHNLIEGRNPTRSYATAQVLGLHSESIPKGIPEA
jgi:hypothetical protein